MDETWLKSCAILLYFELLLVTWPAKCANWDDFLGSCFIPTVYHPNVWEWWNLYNLSSLFTSFSSICLKRRYWWSKFNQNLTNDWQVCILHTDDLRQAWILPLAGAVRFREAIFSDQSWEVARRFFGGSRPGWVGHVHVVQPELLRVAHRPSDWYCHQTSSIFISLTHGCYRWQYFFLLLCVNSSFDIIIVKISCSFLTHSKLSRRLQA